MSRSTGSGCGDASVLSESETGDVPEVCRAVRPATGTTGVHTRTTNKKWRRTDRDRDRDEVEAEKRQRQRRDTDTDTDETQTETEGGEDWREACGVRSGDINDIKDIKDMNPLLCSPVALSLGPIL